MSSIAEKVFVAFKTLSSQQAAVVFDFGELFEDPPSRDRGTRTAWHQCPSGATNRKPGHPESGGLASASRETRRQGEDMTNHKLPFIDGLSGACPVAVEFPKELQLNIALALESEGRNSKVKIENAQWFIEAAQHAAAVHLELENPIFHYPIADDFNEIVDIPLGKKIQRKPVKSLLAVVEKAFKQSQEALDNLPLPLQYELRQRMPCPEFRTEHGIWCVLEDIIFAAGDIRKDLEKFAAHRSNEAGRRSVLIGPMIEAYRKKHGDGPPDSSTAPFTKAVSLVFGWLCGKIQEDKTRCKEETANTRRETKQALAEATAKVNAAREKAKQTGDSEEADKAKMCLMAAERRHKYAVRAAEEADAAARYKNILPGCAGIQKWIREYLHTWK